MERAKAIITDDELGARQVLNALLSEYFPEIEIVALCEDLPQSIKAIKKHKPDLVFMDIEMPGYSGLEVYQFLNSEEITFELIFTTAYNEYATEAFRLAAIDYLLKPIQFNQLKEAILRFKEEQSKQTTIEQLLAFKNNIAGKEEKRMCVSTSEGKYYIPFNEIIALEADGSYTLIHTQNTGKIYTSRRLKVYEELLSGDQRFVRPHRSNMVNTFFVEKLIKGDDAHLVLKNGLHLSISADKVKELEQALL
jgi:two-component system LytT family response regulator